MVKEILVKVAENVLANLQVFFGKRDKTEEYLLRIGEQVYRFVEGTEENVVISSKGTVLKRYPKSRKYINRDGRKDYYEIVHCKPNNANYLQVGLGKTRNAAVVHRLVAEAFLEREEGKPEVDHINRDKQDNRVENLRWVTREENMQNGTHYKTYKERTYWKNIVATNIQTQETVTFSSFREIIPFAKGQGWGKGWGPRLAQVLENQGKAYGYYWKGIKNYKQHKKKP